jgi:hypothetical protein
MNKIILKNGQEFDLVGTGYMKDDMRKIVQFRFESILDIGTVQIAFKDLNAISSIEYWVAGSTLKETITDCVAYQSITQDSEGKYIVTLSTDKISAEIKSTKEELAATQIELESAKEQIAIANSMINALTDTIVLISTPMM